MFYEDVKDLSPSHFKRSTGVKKEVFTLMVDAVSSYKQSIRKHENRGRPPILSIADKILLTLMYYREYRTQFHIGIAYKISESRVCEIIAEMESILIKDDRFHLPGKKKLLRDNDEIEVIIVDVTETPIERPKKNSAENMLARKNDTLRKHK